MSIEDIRISLPSTLHQGRVEGSTSHPQGTCEEPPSLWATVAAQLLQLEANGH